MDKNKSIDGLASRSEKLALASTLRAKTTTKTPTPKKVIIKQAPNTPSKKTSSPPQPSTPNPVNPAKPSTPNTSSLEDFLKPVQAFNFDEQSGELTASNTPIKRTSMKKSPKDPKLDKKSLKKPASKKKKIILSIIITLLSLILIAGIALILWGNDIIAKITGGQGNVFDLLTFVDETYEPLKTDSNGRTNILAFGTSGYNMEGDEGNGTHDGAQLTDSIMVISLDQETGDFVMLSLPRDLKASPTCTATGKINEVYWCNNMYGEDEAAGATALMLEVGDILGLDFQYYAHLNWGALVDIVEILGGITINLDEPIYDYYYTGAVYDAGVDYIIDGGAALAIARARHGTYSGDFSRGNAQQKIIIGIKDKIFEKKLSISDIVSLASTLGDNLRTNFSLEEMKTLAHLSSEFDFNTMRQVSLIDPEPLMITGNINNISYVLPSAGVGNYNAIQSYVAKMFSSDPVIYEDASILVLNSTDTAGLASTEQADLEARGFNYVFIDDFTPEEAFVEPYTLYLINEAKSGTVKILEEKYHITAHSADDLPAGITTDYDFVLIIGDTE